MNGFSVVMQMQFNGESISVDVLRTSGRQLAGRPADRRSLHRRLSSTEKPHSPRHGQNLDHHRAYDGRLGPVQSTPRRSSS